MMKSNSIEAQRKRLLKALKDNLHGLTTIELREDFDIMAPAARVFELRHKFNINIKTINCFAENAQGNSHYCARYVLFSEGGFNHD